MKGLELSRSFFEHCRPILYQEMPDIMAHAAVGKVGEGSECFGLDDELSLDHDFSPGFCFWLPQTVLTTHKDRIAHVIHALPPTWQGLPTSIPGRTGAMALETFLTFFLGHTTLPHNAQTWMALIEHNVACATNGEIFEDNAGQFTALRSHLLAFYPEDVICTKMAARCMQMAQAGQYNVPRCLARNDTSGAFFALSRFAWAALSFVFLINRRYMPFYKHAGRLASSLPLLGPDVTQLLHILTSTPLSLTASAHDILIPSIEDFATKVASFLRNLDLVSMPGNWLWDVGPQIMRKVRDPYLRQQNLVSLP